jgi:hypothetical protein
LEEGARVGSEMFLLGVGGVCSLTVPATSRNTFKMEILARKKNHPFSGSECRKLQKIFSILGSAK